ncbi:HtaA domain-containing protein [Streptomyces sp. NPDC052309]|uniref:HtaA domain-containing protein n=1 Tax=Streptomyces sp. NPDC052309 TaxID=3155421 RepID=UPI0034455011
MPTPSRTAVDDVITVDGIRTTLTAAGAEAFGDLYTAGTELDALDLAVALTDGAPLPGGGSGPSGGAGAAGGSGGASGSTSGGTGSTTGGTGTTTGGVTGGSLASTGSDVPVAAFGAAAAIAVAAGTGAVYAVRRGRPAAR